MAFIVALIVAHDPDAVEAGAVEPLVVWEFVGDRTHRAPVIGGWIILTSSGYGKAMVFMPDPEHKWGQR